MWNRQTSILVLVLIGIISLFFSFQLRHIYFDFEVERFFPVEHEETDFYADFRQEFGNDSDYIFVGITNETIYDSVFLSKIDQLSTALKGLDKVSFVLSPTQIKDVKRIKFPSKIIGTPFLHFKNPRRYNQDSIRIKNHLFFENTLVSSDGKAVQLFVKHHSSLTELECTHLSNNIQRIVNQFEFEESHIAGKCFGQTNYMAMIKKEVLLFVGISTIFVMLLLWMVYRRFWSVGLPLTVVGLTIVWTIGLLCFLGKPIYLITSTIPTLLLVIGISDTVHLMTSYAQKIQTQPSLLALKSAVREVGIATILTTVTTAVGFMTMLYSNFTQLIDLGIFASIGLVFAFGLTYTIFPAFVVLFPKIISNHKFEKQAIITQRLDQLSAFVIRFPNRIIVIATVFLLFSLLGISSLKTDNYMLDDLKEDHALIQSFRFFETHFSGTRPLELALTLKDTSQAVFSLQALQEIEKVGAYLEKEYGVRALFSPSTLIKFANRTQHFDKEEFYRLPQKEETIAFLQKKIKAFNSTFQFDQLISNNGQQARIIGKLPDWGGQKVKQKNDAFITFVEEKLPNSLFDYRFTGTMHLIDLNNQLLVQNILFGLLVAILIVSIIVAVLFRSISLWIITVICNLLPLLIVAGIMGVLGIDIKLSTGLIFIISFGVAVDDSIHFISAFKRQLSRNTIEEAIRKSFSSTGKAITITSIILVGGFSTLCLSDFLGIFYIGFFVALTLLLAIIIDFTLLPALLLKLYKPIKS